MSQVLLRKKINNVGAFLIMRLFWTGQKRSCCAFLNEKMLRVLKNQDQKHGRCHGGCVKQRFVSTSLCFVSGCMLASKNQTDSLSVCCFDNLA